MEPLTGAVIAQLIIKLGPVALDLIQKLAAVWTKELTPAEVAELCSTAKKSYEDYIAEAKLNA